MTRTRARRDRGRAADAERLPGQASFAEEVAGAQHGDHGFLAGLGEHRQLDAALLDVHDAVGTVALRKDHLVRRILDDLLREPGGVEKRLRVEGGTALGI